MTLEVGDRVRALFGDPLVIGEVESVDPEKVIVAWPLGSRYPGRVQAHPPGSLVKQESTSYEVLATDPDTGGQKGRKPEEYSLIPPNALAEVARVYGMGAKKYDSWNWAKGYPYSWSLSALYRHVEAFRKGEAKDQESGLSHLAHAAFHLFTLMEFEINNLGTDDRWKPNED